MTIKVFLNKANGIGEVTVPDVAIHIGPATMEGPKHPIECLADVHREFEGDARQLFNALVKTLPQGTLDRLFVLMAQRAASSFIVPAMKEPTCSCGCATS